MKQIARSGLYVPFFVVIASSILERSGLISKTLNNLLIVLAFICFIVIFWYANRAVWQINGAMKRMSQLNVQPVMEEYLRRRAHGDESFVVPLVLAEGYALMGKGVEAERLAQEALHTAEQAGELKGRSKVTRYFRDLIALTLCDAMAMQGRFAEAGQRELELLPNVLDKRSVAIFAAWKFFMARQDDVARQILSKHFPKVVQGRSKIKIRSPKYKFLGFYMVNKLFGVDTRQHLLQLRTQLSAWETIANNAGDSPYAVRLHEILRDVRQVMGITQE